MVCILVLNKLKLIMIYVFYRKIILLSNENAFIKLPLLDVCNFLFKVAYPPN